MPDSRRVTNSLLFAAAAASIAEGPAAGSVEPATLGHAFLAENGNPVKKQEAFEQALGPRSGGLDIAPLKFCYLDFTADTDAKALFALVAVLAAVPDQPAAIAGPVR